MTATEIAKAQSDSRLRYAMDRLLHRLRDWVRAYPANEADAMPEHDVEWFMNAPGDGPAATILDAIKMHPELWAGAIPSECCIVHRESLKKYAGADAAEYLAGYGAAAVQEQAARLLHEAEMRERRKRLENRGE